MDYYETKTNRIKNSNECDFTTLQAEAYMQQQIYLLNYYCQEGTMEPKIYIKNKNGKLRR